MTDTARLNSDKVFFGITPTSWWNDDFLDIDIGIPFEQCVSEMALAGYSGCSVGHKFPADIAVLKQELALRGLRVSEPWTSLYFTIADMHGQTLADFAHEPSAVPFAILGMCGYLAGVTQAPLTSLVIVMEMTTQHAMVLPLMVTAAIGATVSKLLTPPLYQTLAQRFAGAAPPPPAAGDTDVTNASDRGGESQ